MSDQYISGLSQLKTNRLDSQPTNTNPLTVTEFKFTMQRIPTVTYFCQSANIPSVSLSPIDQTNFFAPVRHPSAFRFDDLSISFVVDEEMKNWLEIYNWMRSASNAEDFKDFETPDQHLSDATLVITNSAMRGKLIVSFRDCFPSSLSGLDFSSAVTDPEPLTATTTFSYSTYTIERIDT